MGCISFRRKEESCSDHLASRRAIRVGRLRSRVRRGVADIDDEQTELLVQSKDRLEERSSISRIWRILVNFRRWGCPLPLEGEGTGGEGFGPSDRFRSLALAVSPQGKKKEATGEWPGLKGTIDLW